MKIIPLLAVLCWSVSACAHQVRWSCDVTFLQSGHHAHRDLRIDADEGTVDDDGIAWRDGASVAVFPDRTQYVTTQDGRILWGPPRRAASGRGDVLPRSRHRPLRA